MFPSGGSGGAFGSGSQATPASAPTTTSFNNASSTLGNGGPTGPAGTTRGRGRGRGAPRGSSRGAGAFGVQRHTNLSWRKPDDTPTNGDEQPAADAQAEAAASASVFGNAGSTFTAFGATSTGGGFGSSSSGANQSASTSTAPVSAFGAAPSAFSGSSAFGATAAPSASTSAFASTSTSTAFPSTSTANPFGGSAFASSAFGATLTPTPPTTASSVPLFRAASQQSEGDGSTEQPQKKRNPAQISTLEVLGEDSDARKKRFEATLPNNRYLELKPLREEQRLAAIKAGTIPDPSKPMRLDQATDFEGTCQEMCPEWEREEREYQNNVDPLERYPGTTRIDPARAVKAFHRPAAGNDQPLPSDVRPAPVLQRTLDYLFHTLLPTQPLAATHPFLRDRTRSVRQDFTVQNIRNVDAVRCNERIARYHILAVGVMREESGFSEQQELEQLRKVLKSLNEFYDDLRLSGTPDPSGNEAEFRAYNLLTHLRDPDIVWSVELLPPEVFRHPLLQRALALHRLAQKSNIPRGERASQNAFSRFFKLVGEPGTPYLFACILSTHFNDIRRSAIDALRAAYLKQHSAFPLRTLAKILGCDDEADARSVCEQLGIVVRTDERGRVVAELHKQAALKAGGLRPKVARRLVEGKRGKTPYPEIIDGLSGKPFDVAAIPSTPSVASHPSFGNQAPPVNVSSAPSAFPPAQSTSTVSKPAPFGTSQISTPVITPPRIATPTPVRPTATTSLDAAAPTFVPSFGQAPPQAAQQKPAPTPLQPPPAGSTFSGFAPTAPAFIPGLKAPPEPSTTSTPSFSFGPPSTGASYAFGGAKVETAAPVLTATPATPIAKPAPAQATPLKPSAAASPALGTPPSALRRVSVTRASPARPSAAALAAAARRTQLVNDLVQHFTAELVSTTAEGPIHRAATSVLKDRWTAIRAEEQRAKRAFAAGAASSAVDELGRLASRESIYRVWRDARRQRTAWHDWKQAVRRSIGRKAYEAEARQEWREVVGAIEAKSARSGGATTTAEDDEDEVMPEVDEDDEGKAGDDDAGIMFEGLSLGSNALDAAIDRVEDQIDRTFANRISIAAAERDKIWAPGTFLNIVADLASKAIAAYPLHERPLWSVLLVTQSTSSPFATWLACKFDLDPSDLSMEVDTPDVDVDVRMVPLSGGVDDGLFDHLGLLVFDCTDMPEVSPEARRRFTDIIDRAQLHSLYSPSLLVLQNARLQTSGSDSKNPASSEQASSVLGLPDLSGFARVGLFQPTLKDAESAFSNELSKLLDDVHLIPGRVERPLGDFVETLAQAWRRSLLRQKKHLSILSQPDAVDACVKTLQGLSSDLHSAAVPRFKRSLLLPKFEAAGRPFEAAVQSYVQDPVFAVAGHFPALRTLLAARPPLSAHVVARSLVDHVADFVFSALSTLRTRQHALDSTMPKIGSRFETSLGELEEKLETLSAGSASPKIGATVSHKKRRASSVSPLESLLGSPKKHANGANGVNSAERTTASVRPQDRLVALEGLMRDARTLLART
ncbi:hypothetical protein JCM10908_005031 [Rhodotorula pacifica]|uniref:Sac3p n=1 Tax=Rhodotorula pacifica TaxID=1495444 RepID=UPI0031789025